MLSTKRRIGQTCPDADWQTTLTRHPRLGARRMFSPTSRLPAGLKAEVDAGRLPVVSIKTSPYTWADVTAGKADQLLLGHLDTLDGLDGPGIRALRDLVAAAYSSGYSDGHQAGDADRWFDEQIRRDFTEAGEE